jgi:curli biogenesis system outer membrane secretion channel CsgG
VTYAVRKAIESAVVQIVKKGEEKELWEFKKEKEK